MGCSALSFCGLILWAGQGEENICLLAAMFLVPSLILCQPRDPVGLPGPTRLWCLTLWQFCVGY
jgi:hypothetical protein